MRTDRIRDLMASRGWSQAELARRTSITQPAIQQILSGSTARSRHLPEIAATLGVTVAYLLGDTDDPAMDIVKYAMPDEMAEQLGVTRVRQVPVEYGMGGGSYIDDYIEEAWTYYDSEWLRSLTTTPAASLFVAKGIGDSMQPTLLDSDSLIVDRAQTIVKQQDRIWALTYGDVGMIKRVRRKPHGKYLIMSDSAHVSDFEAMDDEVRFLGRVIWIGRRT